MPTIKSKITSINKSLVLFYGIPKRNANTPDAVTTLIGTILSQNTNDKNSYKAYMNLTRQYSDWETVADLLLPEIESAIRTAGLAKQKAKAIKGVLNGIKRDQDKISLNFLSDMDNKSAIEVLTAFDGVGVKTASCVLLFSLLRNVCPVDTHVNRTLNRLGIVTAANPEKTFWTVFSEIPENTAHTFHTNLIRLGREFCRPSKLYCGNCPVVKNCIYSEKSNDVFQYKENSFLLLDSL